MNTFVIAGGNSGIGLQAARELITAANRVVILGRDKRKGEEALAEEICPRAGFLPVSVEQPGEQADRIDQPSLLARREPLGHGVD
jgi:NAD(P)-dependent dehydrogenase (short-subunit alcohol dehydrogenase family)